MADDLFCWPCACVFVLFEHMAFVIVFCVPYAPISILLTPPILLTDYWLIFPTCLPSLHSSFAPIIISLRLQSCASSSSMLPCVVSCLALPCPAKPCCQSIFPYRVVFIYCCFVLFYTNKAHFPASQVTFIYIARLTIQIVSKQLHNTK